MECDSMNTETRSVVQILATTEPRLYRLGWNIGVKIKDLDTRETFWVNHYNYKIQPLKFGKYYIYDYKLSSFISRVQRKTK